MVDNSPADPLDHVFGALADPTRRAIVARLVAEGSATVGELAAPFPISLAAVSKHLHVLERAGLLEREVRGRTHLCRVEPAPLDAALGWVTRQRRFWERRLDALEDLLAQPADATRT